MCNSFAFQVINSRLLSQFPVHPFPIGKSSRSKRHSESKEDPELRRRYCQLAHGVRGKELHPEQSLPVSVYRFKGTGMDEKL